MLFLSHLSVYECERHLPLRACMPSSAPGEPGGKGPGEFPGKPAAEPADAPLQYPLHALHAEYAVPSEAAFSKSCPERLLDTAVPVSIGRSASALALEAAQQLLSREDELRHRCQYLIYGHDTVEPSFYLTPGLFIKKKLGLKQTLPFALSHCGSTVFPAALDMLGALAADRGTEPRPSLVVIGDQCTDPMPRVWFDQYPKGDAAAACACSHTAGEWEVVAVRSEEWPLPTNHPYVWSEREQREQERFLIERSRAMTASFLHEHSSRRKQIRHAIVQRLSPGFTQSLSEVWGDDIGIYRRAYAPDCNLLGSDCLYTLRELERAQITAPGECVVLLTAGPLSRAGVLLLQRT